MQATQILICRTQNQAVSQNICSLPKKLRKAQKHDGIARSHGIPIKGIVYFHITMESCLFTENSFTEKPESSLSAFSVKLFYSKGVRGEPSLLTIHVHKIQRIKKNSNNIFHVPSSPDFRWEDKVETKKNITDIFEFGLLSVLPTVKVATIGTWRVR